VSIGYYNNDPTLIAAIRGAKNDFKSVYTGFGLEQVSDQSVRNEFMKLTWQWFHGIITSTEYDAAVATLGIGQNYPNPVSSATVIPLTPGTRERSLLVYDMTGRLMLTQRVAPATTQLQLDAAALRPGTYFYRLFDGTALVGSRVMQVQR
jgi:hypothetical protein